MSGLWLWLIVYLYFFSIPTIQSRYLRLPPVNCSEFSPIGTSITQVLSLLPPSNWGFTFLTRTSVVSYFLLDDLKGTITVKRPLDREDLCRLGLCSCIHDCLLKLDINALSDTQTQIINLPIRILDENDNFCYFANDIHYLNISESVRLSTRLVLPIAHDPDQTPYNVQSYSISPDSPSPFRLDYHLTPSLIVVEALDREVRDKYLFDFCAYEDLANLNRSCCTKIHLSVTDVNDNAAKFRADQQSPVTISVSEQMPIHSELIRMQATDADEGVNGEVRYTFSKWTQNDATISQLFHLNPDNGSITLLKLLDYEQRNNYELQIQAKDRGVNAIPSYATVIVQVVDENDCVPEMFAFSPADVQLINNSIYVVENLAVGTPILYLTVSDRDSGKNGQVTIELRSTTNSIPFVRLERVTENAYSVRMNLLLDREQQSLYSFTLLASDHGQPKQSIESVFELHLIDVNDCSPTFDPSSNYSFTIDENNREESILQTIHVSDPDEEDHLSIQLIFDTDSSLANLFKLNEQNQLLVLKSLDYEQQAVYHFAIRAEDALGHRTTLPIVVQLNDLNDNPVTFATNSTRFYLEENQPNRTFLGQIRAEDADRHDQITYSIHPDDIEEVDAFIQLTSNGSLLTKISLDREQIDQLEFRAIANDSLHTASLTIEVVILDQNDHRPTLRNVSPLCFVHNTSNSSQMIHIQLEGDDPDEGDNGDIFFSLLNPSSSDILLLPNGTLIVPGRLGKYRFGVHLEDSGKPTGLSSVTKDVRLFIVSQPNDCHTYSIASPIQLEQRTLIYLLTMILFCFVAFTIITVSLCCCCFCRQRRRKLSLNDKTTPNLTPSFSSSLNGEAENDTLLLSSPSPQFTAMTTVSISTTTTNDSTRLTTFVDRPTNKSSSLSSSSSSTYVKMSRSFEDEML